MSDETKNNLHVETEGMVDTAIDAVADLALGQAVPAPIRKGFVAACKRLCNISESTKESIFYYAAVSVEALAARECLLVV